MCEGPRLLGLFLPMRGCLMCSEGCRTWGEPQHHKALVLFGGCSLWRFGTVPLNDSPWGFTGRTLVLRHEAQGTLCHLVGRLQPGLDCSEEVNLQQFPRTLPSVLLPCGQGAACLHPVCLTHSSLAAPSPLWPLGTHGQALPFDSSQVIMGSCGFAPTLFLSLVICSKSLLRPVVSAELSRSWHTAGRLLLCQRADAC